MIHYETLRSSTPASGTVTPDAIADFLFTHLDQYGDKREDIMKCLGYALGKGEGTGGFITAALENEEILGAVVINETGMSGYIPENILVYIAVRGDQRGRGIGKGLMEQAISQTNGDIALHVEPDNPAKKLYEKLGFTNKYLEMRLKK
jgi:ribosomal protein S18 acetylase RimI-like enzyme